MKVAGGHNHSSRGKSLAPNNNNNNNIIIIIIIKSCPSQWHICACRVHIYIYIDIYGSRHNWLYYCCEVVWVVVLCVFLYL